MARGAAAEPGWRGAGSGGAAAGGGATSGAGGRAVKVGTYPPLGISMKTGSSLPDRR